MLRSRGMRGTEDDMPEHFWALTLHEDVVEAGRDWETFSSQRGSVHLMRHESEDELSAFRTIIDTDPPAHTRLRRIVNRGFTPRAVAAIEEHYRIVAREIIDAAIERGTVDFVSSVAAELPLVAIAELLGVPVEERHKIFAWTNRMVGRTDPEYDFGPDAPTDAAAELYAYASSLAAQRRSEPRGDIISKLITEVDGDALGEHGSSCSCSRCPSPGTRPRATPSRTGSTACWNIPARWPGSAPTNRG